MNTPDAVASPSTLLYKRVSFVLALLFGAAGLIFLVRPDWAVVGTNSICRPLGIQELQPYGFGFYQVLAVAYMAMVALLAFLMVLHPEEPIYPRLLICGKGTSSGLSLLMLFVHGPYLLYGVNFAVDGSIAFLVYLLYRVRWRGTA